MKKPTAYIVDDELRAVQRLERLVRENGKLEIVGTSMNPEQALDELEANPADVLLTDVEMPEMTGFGLASRLRPMPLIVFTTAHEHYAAKAFETSAVDYLVKPVSTQALDRAVEKIYSALALRELQKEGEEPIHRSRGGDFAESSPARVISRVGGRIHLIPIDEISYFRADEGLTFAVTDAGEHIVDTSIRELESQFEAIGFFRVHRNALVRLSHVRELRSSPVGLTAMVGIEKKHEVSVARDRVKELKDALGV